MDRAITWPRGDALRVGMLDRAVSRLPRLIELPGEVQRVGKAGQSIDQDIAPGSPGKG